MSLFEWSEEYSVGIARFDDDHRRLIGLVNQLDAAMVEGRGSEVVSGVLQELADYARRHFAAEEQAMRKAGFAGLEPHIAEHKELTAQLERFCDQFSRSNRGLPRELLFFMRNWLQMHVLGSDRAYVDALKQAGIE